MVTSTPVNSIMRGMLSKELPESIQETCSREISKPAELGDEHGDL